ncbi:galactose-1-phosphate uridyl transferase [Vanrija albida]|uniref:Galactose-1-phosphate uridylyltransferase n=1 Tax=Vanrija albida TaxID=181172 RepID=A0ABR3QFJ6_9TREE
MTLPSFEPTEHPHRRYNPLTGKHVLVSPHRTKRPWNGQTEEPVKVSLPAHDPKCYLCPGNNRIGGHKNPHYEHTYLFANDFPALLPGDLPLVSGSMPELPASGSVPDGVDGLFASEPVRGRCSVLCFHPRHDVTLARMAHKDILAVVQKWRKVYLQEADFLRSTARPNTKDEGYVQIFENRGDMMGASAPHPHGQIWTLSYVPDEPATELDNLAKYAASASAVASAKAHPDHPVRGDGAPCLLCAYAADEVRRGERVVAIDEEGGWVAVVPFWAVWPFEVMVLPYKRHIPSIAQMTPEEDAGLARVLKETLIRYDNLFSCPFPYSMGLHQAPLPPTNPDSDPAHTHFHFYPPLLRSATVRKFLVGFEMLGEAQRDLTAEQAATRLRNLDTVHYLDLQSRVPSPHGSPPK